LNLISLLLPHSMQGGCIPNPFPIPTFRSTTEKNFHNKLLTDCDRKYVVQTLATVLMTHVQRPSLSDCDIVAKALVRKFSFLNDVEGSGQVRRYISCIHITTALNRADLKFASYFVIICLQISTVQLISYFILIPKHA